MVTFIKYGRNIPKRGSNSVSFPYLSVFALSNSFLINSNEPLRLELNLHYEQQLYFESVYFFLIEKSFDKKVR